jgi:hypothetical protein
MHCNIGCNYQCYDAFAELSKLYIIFTGNIRKVIYSYLSFVKGSLQELCLFIIRDPGEWLKAT